jgi:hypothetical protein
MARGTARGKGSVMVRSAEFMGWALGGLEREIAETRERLAVLVAEAGKLRAKVGRTGRGTAASAAEPAAPRRRRRRSPMSAESRRRLSESRSKRWADRQKKGLNTL